MSFSDSEVNEVSLNYIQYIAGKVASKKRDLLLHLPGSERVSEFATLDVSIESPKVLEVVLVLKLVPERYDCQSLLEFSPLLLIDPPQGSFLRMCSMVNLRTLLFVVGDGQCSIVASGAACMLFSREFLLLRQISCFNVWRYEFQWYRRVPSPFGTNHGEAIVLTEEKKFSRTKAS